VCRLVVEELLAVGGEQAEGSKSPLRPRQVALAAIDTQPIIPASSLRGLLSSLAEAASNSTLRVLENQPINISTGYDPKSRSVGRNLLGSVHEWFQKENLELVPLRQGDGRHCLTLAEQLFGLVEFPGNQPGTGELPPVLALASRVRLSMARPWPADKVRQLEKPGVTKILDSPKPKSPVLYLKDTHEKGRYITKASINQRNARVQGRKFFLHRGKLEDEDWKTLVKHSQAEPDKRLHQKASVAPLTRGTTFWFHLDFQNLSTLELELLCYVLRPAQSFRHKLGMGKPLGLGKVGIEPVGIFFIDRIKRYHEDAVDPDSKRYHRVWRDSTLSPELWPDTYKLEREAANTASVTPSPTDFSKAYRDRITQCFPNLVHVLNAIELLSNPDAVKYPVHYPQIAEAEGPATENEQFKWWQENDRFGGQMVYDLLEPFRCRLERFVIKTINRRIVQLEEFARDDEKRWRLGPEGSAKFLEAFEREMEVKPAGEPCTWRQLIIGQVLAVREWVEGRPLRFFTRV
jgi:CRISPR/Cas system CSM-associated protein Csm3 (group 7 of RAMP superfamily)